ncbi:hypothetical protein T261_08905 [Streptomyces lydicus]|nr:hypothetical protein T261_08905 [Streptomyces lydicus]
MGGFGCPSLRPFPCTRGGDSACVSITWWWNVSSRKREGDNMSSG